MTFLALAGLVLGAMIVGGLIGASVMCVIHYEEGKREMEAGKEPPPDMRRPAPPEMPPRKRSPVDEWI